MHGGPSICAVRKIFRGVALCAVLLGGYAACYPQWTANAMQRLLCPTDPAGHLLAADIQVTPGNAHVVEGDDLPSRPWSGASPQYMPKTVKIEYRVPGMAWRTGIMRGSAAGTEFAFALTSVPRPWNIASAPAAR